MGGAVVCPAVDVVCPAVGVVCPAVGVAVARVVGAVEGDPASAGPLGDADPAVTSPDRPSALGWAQPDTVPASNRTQHRAAT